MVIDTSAIVAAIAVEPDHIRYEDAIKGNDFVHTDIIAALDPA